MLDPQVDQQVYTIIDDKYLPPSKDIHALVLDRPFRASGRHVRIDGKEYSYNLVSFEDWVIIHSEGSLKGKTAVFF